MFGGEAMAEAGQVREYSFKRGTWRSLPSLTPLRHSIGAAIFRDLNGKKKILIVGGSYGLTVYDKAEILDIETDTLTAVAPYPSVSL